MTSFNDSCSGTWLSPSFMRNSYLGLLPGHSLLDLSIGGGGTSHERLHVFTCETNNNTVATTTTVSGTVNNNNKNHGGGTDTPH